MSIEKVNLRIKDNVDLNEVLPKYGFTFETVGEYSFWSKSITISKWGFIGVDKVFINKDTRVIDYYRKPIFNYDLCEGVRDLIEDDLVDVIIEKKEDYIKIQLPTLSKLLSIEEGQEFRFKHNNGGTSLTYVIVDNKLCYAHEIPYVPSSYEINQLLNNGIIGIELVKE